MLLIRLQMQNKIHYKSMFHNFHFKCLWNDSDTFACRGRFCDINVSNIFNFNLASFKVLVPFIR